MVESWGKNRDRAAELKGRTPDLTRSPKDLAAPSKEDLRRQLREAAANTERLSEERKPNNSDTPEKNHS